MSLLINGVDMSDSCRHCRFCIPTEPDCDDSPYECVLNDYLHWATWLDVPNFVSEGCQLIKLPTPHGDLIDRDDLLAYFEKKSKGKTAEEALKLLYTALKAYPTVIEKEIS